MGAKIDLFSGEGGGIRNQKCHRTGATTDKNDPFLNMGFKHGKKWVDKNGAKCKMGFGRATKNTRGSFRGILVVFLMAGKSARLSSRAVV